ncbi:MAG: methyltransferase domain-containing protein [Alphaproteobacteria bacterium]
MATPALFDPIMFDDAAIIAKRNLLAKQDCPPNRLQAEIALRLNERIDEVKRSFNQRLIYGYRPEDQPLLDHNIAAKLSIIEPAPALAALAATRNPNATILNTPILNTPMSAGLKDIALAPQTHDLILSNLLLHWVNDLPELLRQFHNILIPDGLLLASAIGGTSLSALRQALLQAESDLSPKVHPRIIPMLDIKDLGGLAMSANFTLPMVDKDVIRMEFRNFYDALKSLKRMGENNMLSSRQRGCAPKALFAGAAYYFEQLTGQAPDQPLIFEFEILFLTAWRADHSQPKALTPGAATHDLKDFL